MVKPTLFKTDYRAFYYSYGRDNNGIALLFNRLDNKMFQDVVFPKAKGILFMKGRIKFHREDGTIGESPGCGSILVAFGEENAEILRSSNIEGRYIQVDQEPCNTHVDWEQRRFDLVKAYSIEFIKTLHRKGEIDCGVYVPDVVSWSITIADRIIEAMRGAKNA